MQLTKETQLCISIAARPGNFGTLFFNRVFKALNFDYIYKAFQLAPEGDLEGVLRGARALGVRGISVSMPFKEQVLPFLDFLGERVGEIGAVNTIVNNEGKLSGYNTDYLGALELLQRECDVKNQPVYLCGLGGVAKALVLALKKLGAHIIISGRDKYKLDTFARNMNCKKIPFNELQNVEGYLFINATPVGMLPHENENILSSKTLKSFKAVFDVVAQPAETILLQSAKALGLKTISGTQLAFEQALKQFELYTTVLPSRKQISELFNEQHA